MPATFMLAFAWNPVVGVPMLIVGTLALALIWLFGQPKREQGKRRTEPGASKGARREPVIGDQPGDHHESPVAAEHDAMPHAGFVTAPAQGELDVGLRAELERLGATLSADHASPSTPSPKAQPKLADHVASIINALRAPPGADSTSWMEPATNSTTPSVRREPSMPLATALAPKSDLGHRPAQIPVERIVTLFVVAREGALFNGADLVVAADKAGLEYGDMGIYHRLVDGKRELGPIFSVANMLKPGSFNLGNLDLMHTPGVSFFMTLPGPLSALDAWDAMLPTAQRMAELLDGLVLDEERNALGRQCVAHIRDQLRNWDRDHEGGEIDFRR